MTYKVDFQTVFQIWPNSDISHFPFRQFRKQNEKPVTAFICIHVMLSLLYLTIYQSALHKWSWDVSSGLCHNIMWERNCGVHIFGKKCRCVVGWSRSCSNPVGLGSKRSRTLGYCEEQTSLAMRYSYCQPNWKLYLKYGTESIFYSTTLNMPKIQYIFYFNFVDTPISQLFWPVFPSWVHDLLLFTQITYSGRGLTDTWCYLLNQAWREGEENRKDRALFPACSLLQPSPNVIPLLSTVDFNSTFSLCTFLSFIRNLHSHDKKGYVVCYWFWWD